MNDAVAVVGMACRYPDARSPVQLWENVLAGRRAFRRIPAQRLLVEDYYSADPIATDSIYSTEACLIDNYEFDRVKFRVASTTYRAADHAHWLALDVAAEALEDAGFQNGDGLPRQTTGVIVGNTLTGEFSRANTLRLRWPYTRRVLESMFLELGWAPETRAEFLSECERRYKAPFAPMNEETLAGNLSNTIAGRICNHFDLKGAGYTVDGACASSLLAVSTSCSALISRDLDVALAGGVDLSIDPFELVGFARAGALARGPMLVYDRRSSGFLPGEGCGFVVLMRHKDAVAHRFRIYAVIRGWGVSSDGAGGMTRPEIEGQALALERAYNRAGFDIGTVAYFEGHGTGTSVGDTTELKALSKARGQSGANYRAVLGSIKANIGHTKAAAGVAGLIKTVMAVRHQIIPPTTACQLPHAEIEREDTSLRISRDGEPWDPHQAVRAGVSAMGFGGINTHVVVEGVGPRRFGPLAETDRALLASSRDAELFLLFSDGQVALEQMVRHLCSIAGRLSYAELGDLAAHLAAMPATDLAGSLKAAVVASTPRELENRLRMLLVRLEQGADRELDVSGGVFIGTGQKAAIGFLFPGQAAPVYLDGGSFARSFPLIRELYSRADLPVSLDASSTALAQPAIVASSLAGLRLLEKCGLEAEVAVGHSVGEIAALQWAGAIEEGAAIRIASARGRSMAEVERVEGRMASVRANRDAVKRMLKGSSLVIACFNARNQTVVSGERSEIEEFIRIAQQEALGPILLPVSQAFHSPLVAPAGAALRSHLSSEAFRTARRRVVSTVTGSELPPDADLTALLVRQIDSPVLFEDALAQVSSSVELFIEVGPGEVLSGILRDSSAIPVIPLDSCGASLKGLLKAVAAAYVLGSPVDRRTLFEGRFTRPFQLPWNPCFFVNPCEMAPILDSSGSSFPPVSPRAVSDDGDGDMALKYEPAAEQTPCDTRDGILDLIRGLVAQKTDLPAGAIQPSYRLLGDLHLNSITVSQIVTEAARRLTLAPPVAPTDYSVVSIADVAAALDELRLSGGAGAIPRKIMPGVDSWVRCFQIKLVDKPLKGRRRQFSQHGTWQVMAPPNCTFAKGLLERLGRMDGNGVAVVLGHDHHESNVALLLEAARKALSNRDATDFLLVQHGTFGAAFARSFHLEAPWLNCCVVEIPADHSEAIDLIAAEVAVATGFSHAVYDSDGVRRIPLLNLLEVERGQAGFAPGPKDVVLVTGGGKGIAAECALGLARHSRSRLAILGRSVPKADAELAANLRRLASYGIEFRYYTCDVKDRQAVLEAISKVEGELGNITTIIHGAGVNSPKLIDSLTVTDCAETLEPKLRGAQNLLDSIDNSHLRLFVSFGSLIGRTGMRGEAHYALANELLRDLTQTWQLDHPRCRCLCVEWSVWAGPGMGQRLGTLDALLQEGIAPISLDQGIDTLLRLILEGQASGSVVVTGRFGEPPTLNIERPELPFRRFLEHTKVYYPGVELIVEAEISTAADPYIGDHIFQGDALFPAVMGLEAMAQAAMALAGENSPPAFDDVEFNRAIIIPLEGTTRINIAALMREDRAVEVVVRSQDTDYQVIHFRAVCRVDAVQSLPEPQWPLPHPRIMAEETTEISSLVPERDLYGSLLFHEGRFVRVIRYYKITATQCIADVGESDSAWFGSYLPRTLVLGCPARRDGAIHSIQACVPDASLLPVGAGRLRIYHANHSGSCRVIARERDRGPGLFVYDVCVVAEDGRLLESWEGLKLRRVSPNQMRGGWPLPLLVPYIERCVSDTGGNSQVSIALDFANGDRRSRSEGVIRWALSDCGELVRRPDGKPEALSGRGVSSSHLRDVTMAVAGSPPVACDIEPVISRASGIWRDLLGDQGFTLAQVISRETGDDLDAAGTRVWAALECLRKSGAPVSAPLTLADPIDGPTVLSSGNLSIITVCVTIAGGIGHTVLAVLSGTGRARTSDACELEYEAAGTSRRVTSG